MPFLLPCCVAFHSPTLSFLYVMAIISIATFAGLMSGLTMALMSLDHNDLEVLINSGSPHDQFNAGKIFPLLKNQHLLLCTLLIGNSLAMAALPIFLNAIVPGWASVVLSVIFKLVFGEILAEAFCIRYGLRFGAFLAPMIRVLLILFLPISYPISKVLDWMLDKGHCVILRRAELETSMNFHGKTAKDAMSPISSAFSLDLDSILNLDIEKSTIPDFPPNEEVVGVITIEDVIEELLHEEIESYSKAFIFFHSTAPKHEESTQTL